MNSYELAQAELKAQQWNNYFEGKRYNQYERDY